MFAPTSNLAAASSSAEVGTAYLHHLPPTYRIGTFSSASHLHQQSAAALRYGYVTDKGAIDCHSNHCA